MPSRRQFVAAGSGFIASSLLAPWARSASLGLSATLSGPEVALTVGHTHSTVGGKSAHAIAVNGTIPAPLIRLKEHQTVRLAVTNKLDEDTSIHWHGLLVPHQFDGVPGLSFPGIRPGETFVYEFHVHQSGTYWYHSHSGLQEQMGHYGPIIIDPAGADPVAYDREYVVVLSEFTALHPHDIFKRLKQQPGVFNRQKQTLFGGDRLPADERLAWAKMRMDPTDISDVTGAAYTYLINGHSGADNWTALFRPGERVRLRFINASAMTIFNVRIPGLEMSVVQADGQNVRPVTVEEFQLSIAETLDVVVIPREDRAFALVAEAIDRSGMAHATLAPRAGMRAEVPLLRRRPFATMKDMGMGAMDHGGHGAHAGHDMPQVKTGPGVQMLAPMAVDRTGEPGQGLEDVGHRVLTYKDLIALDVNPDTRAPSREMEIHLTGNMERFMWSFDGEKFSEVTAPISFQRGERVRVTLVNDTMMNHPIHLHGHFFELAHGPEGHQPRKHTVNVAPGGKVIFDLTADAPGDWAFHCHMLYHMHAGMFQVVRVRPL